ncbi:MAG: hypothetical protein Q8J62_00870 [Candidatus Cloacimonadaceae bacterium]|nr:hypothetical protein [Candidatus Cloacimonadaceae bacterium]
MTKLTITLVLICLWFLVPVYAQATLDDFDCIAIKFSSGVNPRLENGIVVTGFPSIDSLNVHHHANNF